MRERKGGWEGVRRKGRKENDLTHPLSQISGYATGLEFTEDLYILLLHVAALRAVCFIFVL